MEQMDFSFNNEGPEKKTSKKKKCPVENCKFSAINNYHVKYHMLTKHGLGQKLVCPICEAYTCANNSMLNSHMKSHSEVRSHSCKTCGASYKFSYKLKQHLTKHPSHVPTTDASSPAPEPKRQRGRKRSSTNKVANNNMEKEAGNVNGRGNEDHGCTTPTEVSQTMERRSSTNNVTNNNVEEEAGNVNGNNRGKQNVEAAVENAMHGEHQNERAHVVAISAEVSQTMRSKPRKGVPRKITWFAPPSDNEEITNEKLS